MAWCIDPGPISNEQTDLDAIYFKEDIRPWKPCTLANCRRICQQYKARWQAYREKARAMRAQVRAYKTYMAEMASAAKRRLSVRGSSVDIEAEIAKLTAEANSLRTQISELSPLLEETTKQAENTFDDDARELLAEQEKKKVVLDQALAVALENLAKAELAAAEAKIAQINENIEKLRTEIEAIEAAAQPEPEPGSLVGTPPGMIANATLAEKQAELAVLEEALREIKLNLHMREVETNGPLPGTAGSVRSHLNSPGFESGPENDLVHDVEALEDIPAADSEVLNIVENSDQMSTTVNVSGITISECETDGDEWIAQLPVHQLTLERDFPDDVPKFIVDFQAGVATLTQLPGGASAVVVKSVEPGSVVVDFQLAVADQQLTVSIEKSLADALGKTLAGGFIMSFKSGSPKVPKKKKKKGNKMQKKGKAAPKKPRKKKK